jgi:hypothetical protein
MSGLIGPLRLFGRECKSHATTIAFAIPQARTAAQKQPAPANRCAKGTPHTKKSTLIHKSAFQPNKMAQNAAEITPHKGPHTPRQASPIFATSHHFEASAPQAT